MKKAYTIISTSNSFSTNKIFRVFHLLSIDIVAGAAGGFIFASRILHQSVKFREIIILSSIVWLIYCADHLMDSFQAGSDLKYHLFRNYRKIFLLTGIVLSLTLIPLVLTSFSFKEIIQGLFIACSLLIYLTLQFFLKYPYRKYFPKEILISAIYIAGIWIIPLYRAINVKFESLELLTIHFLLVLQNVILFTLYDKKEDLHLGKSAILSHLPEKKLSGIILGINISIHLFGLYQMFYLSCMPVFFIPWAINFCYTWLIFKKSSIENKVIFPWIADGIFVTFLFSIFL